MESQLVIDVNNRSGEARIALLEGGELVEYRTQRRNAEFSMGDIYLGVVRRVRDNHNAAFVDVGSPREGFLHMKEVADHYTFMVGVVGSFLRGEVTGRVGARGRGKGKGRGSEGSSSDAVSESDSVMAEALSRFHFTAEGEGEGRGGARIRKKAQRISSIVKPNQVVLVQVARESIGTKGPSLTTDISVAGHTLVLLPFGDRVHVSTRITNRNESERLRRLVQSILPQGYGVIVRTAAEGKKVETLHLELEDLLHRWRECVGKLMQKGNIPRLLLNEMSNSVAALRDNLNTDYSSVQVNDKDFYTELRDYLASIAPQRADCVKLYQSARVPIFDHFGVTRQLKRLLGRTVPFHGGSYLIVEHTEALHVIDVNSGRGARKADTPEETAFEVNRAACEEISRQLRLRDMGGIIVLDLIDMSDAKHREQILKHMRELMKRDRVTHKILPITEFGLMQITRQRVRVEQDIDTSEHCPCCGGTGRVESTVLLEEEIEERLKQMVEEGGYKRIEVRVHPYVAAYFNQGLYNTHRQKMGRRVGCSLTFKAVASYNMLEYRFFTTKGEELTRYAGPRRRGEQKSA